MKKLWQAIRGMFGPIEFPPLEPMDLDCTHEGSSSCPIKTDPRTGVMSFDHGGETTYPLTNSSN